MYFSITSQKQDNPMENAMGDINVNTDLIFLQKIK